MVGRSEVLASARRIAARGIAPDAASIAASIGSSPDEVERLTSQDADLRRRLDVLRSLSARSGSQRSRSGSPAHRADDASRQSSGRFVSAAERLARKQYGADENPEESLYADFRLPADMSWGGGNQGGFGSLRQ